MIITVCGTFIIQTHLAVGFSPIPRLVPWSIHIIILKRLGTSG